MAELNTARIHEKLKAKKNLLLHRIRRAGRAGRLELARRLRISNTRVCEMVQEMLDEKLLIEDFPGKDRRGRLPVPVELNPKHGHLVGFDMEAKRLRLTIVDFQGAVVWQTHKPFVAPGERGKLVAALLDYIESNVASVRNRFEPLLGIGLAAAGVVDAQAGVILHYDLIPAARDIPLRDLASASLGLPAVLENNIRMLTLGEWMGGAGRQLSSFVCVAVRSGLACGIVMNGRLFVGSHGFAGEVGYMPLPTAGSPARWKTLNATVSEQALGVNAEAADFRLPEAVARHAGELLGSQLASIAIVLDPEAILLAGGLLHPDGPLWGPAESAFHRFVFPEIGKRVPLVAAALGPFGAAIGATHRCFEMLYPVETGAH
ncbi:MAG: ROK family protein [Candidatus Sumerlaeota bacterium]|nr:ROK family protein [Candidatus Sumerlaeota bacterium]